MTPEPVHDEFGQTSGLRGVRPGLVHRIAVRVLHEARAAVVRPCFSLSALILSS